MHKLYVLFVKPSHIITWHDMEPFMRQYQYACPKGADATRYMDLHMMIHQSNNWIFFRESIYLSF